jgi:TRAP-type mannitol/chloroaromatic compound transport system substrate-binding protein
MGCYGRARTWGWAMDRRTFLKTGAGAAAAATAAESARADTATPHAPSLSASCRELRVAVADRQKDAAVALVRRIELATGGRFRLLTAGSQSPLQEVASGEADLYLSTELAHQRIEPALAYYAGLPHAVGLSPVHHHAWLTVGGGQLLWDDLGSTLGVKPLLAGYEPRPGLWLSKAASGRNGWTGLRVHATGFAADVVRRLGSQVMSLPDADTATALARGEIDVAEGSGALNDVTLGLAERARHYVEPGILEASALCFGVRRNTWDLLSAQDQAVFAACAGEELRQSLALLEVESRMGREVLRSQHAIAIAELPHPLAAPLSTAAGEELARVAETSIRARRIADSYQAFRTLMGEFTV